MSPDWPNPQGPYKARSGSTVVEVIGGALVRREGCELPVPDSSMRLLAYIALADGPVARHRVAGTLWPEVPDVRASGNLRTALWRLHGIHIDLVHTNNCALALAPDTKVDARMMLAWASRIIEGRAEDGELAVPWPELNTLEVLPGWGEDWAVFAGERIRQRALHALEALSRTLTRRHEWAGAIEAAMAAVRFEPLRESSHRALVEAHLSEGNYAEALRVFTAYRDLVRECLSIAPSPEFTALLRPACYSITRVMNR